MPEGHTIHRLAARHRDLFAGHKVDLTSPQGRFAEGAALLSGRLLTGTEALGKHLLHHYDSGSTVHVHLGLYGTVSDGAGSPPPPVGQVRMRMVGGGHWLDLRGPTDCSVLSPPEVSSLRARLGADPLRADAVPDPALARIRRSSAAIAALLLDQSILAGVGLVYASEVLFRAGIGADPAGAVAVAGAGAGAVDRSARADGRRGRARADRHRAQRAPAGGDGPGAEDGPARR